jgi:hypothetical protein
MPQRPMRQSLSYHGSFRAKGQPLCPLGTKHYSRRLVRSSKIWFPNGQPKRQIFIQFVKVISRINILSILFPNIYI